MHKVWLWYIRQQHWSYHNHFCLQYSGLVQSDPNIFMGTLRPPAIPTTLWCTQITNYAHTSKALKSVGRHLVTRPSNLFLTPLFPRWSSLSRTPSHRMTIVSISPHITLISLTLNDSSEAPIGECMDSYSTVLALGILVGGCGTVYLPFAWKRRLLLDLPVSGLGLSGSSFLSFHPPLSTPDWPPPIQNECSSWSCANASWHVLLHSKSIRVL